MSDLTDLQKLSQGAFLSSVQESVAKSPDRLRATADRAWTIASAIGGVLVAVGFTSSLQAARGVVQVFGISAISLWLLSAILFLRVALPPESAHLTTYEARARAEIGSPPPDSPEVMFETTDRLVQTVAVRDFLASRIRQGIVLASIAIVSTGLALASTVVWSGGSGATGKLMLTTDGQSVVAAVCPRLKTTSIAKSDGTTQTLLASPPVVSLEDTSDIGGDGTVEVMMAAGDCTDQVAHLELDSSTVLGLSS